MPESGRMSKKNNDKTGGPGVPDSALWEIVTKDVQPLKRSAPRMERAITDHENPPKKTSRSVRSSTEIPRLPASDQSVKSHPSVGLDTRTLEKLRNGQMPIEGRIDLHGLSQARAHAALNRFILEAYAEGKRCVLVITGKGAGVLKSAAPEWLAQEPLGAAVLKVQSAQPRHGGEGALYVYLRRVRD
jgi:DNA-nicking Smr family endonuclease